MADTDTQPNLLFLLSDQHNHRCLGHIDADRGGEPVDTPALDDLAENGTVFEQTYCQVPLCTPSRISMLTGRPVRESGGWRNGSVLEPGLETLPGAFSAAGYETCLVGKMHLGGDRQFAGFDHRPYGDLTGGAGHQYEPLFESLDYESINLVDGAAKDHAYKVMDPRWRHAEVTDADVTEFPESALQEANVVRESLAFLREHDRRATDQPWFLCASFSRPHPPYTAPERWLDRYWPDGVTEPGVSIDETGASDHPLSRGLADFFLIDDLDEADELYARAAYFACVSYLDELVGDLLASLDRDGLLDDTVVVYTSDHGNMIGDHGLWGKRSWHEDSSRVPWIVQTPAHRSGDRSPSSVSTAVSLEDLFPTLCGLAGLPAPDDLPGADLSAAVAGGAEPDRGPVFCDYLLTRFGEGTEYRVIRDGRYKYVGFRDAPELLFDLASDPKETENLATATEHESSLERLRDLLDETMDFEAAAEERERAAEREREHDSPIPPGHGNAYHMPDGRIVDAETPLFQPNVLARDASSAFGDWPQEGE